MRVWAKFRGRGLLWFRVLGYGLVVKDTRVHRLLYSERERGRGRQLGPYRVRFLRPDQRAAS